MAKQSVVQRSNSNRANSKRATARRANSRRASSRRANSKGIIRYGKPTAKGGLVTGNERTIDAVDRHVTQHLGEPDYVLHEILSPLVHIDIHVVKPTKERPYWYLITSGMSDLAMRTPPGCAAFKYAELAISLPAWWKVDEKSFESEKWYWPVRWMKTLARFPHEYETWVFYQHTVPLSDGLPATGTKFCGVMMAMDSEFPEDFWLLKDGKRKIFFLAPVPIYPEEMEWKLEHGPDSLDDRMAAIGPANSWDSYDPKRPNSCAPARRSKPKAAGVKKARGSRPGATRAKAAAKGSGKARSRG